MISECARLSGACQGRLKLEQCRAAGRCVPYMERTQAMGPWWTSVLGADPSIVAQATSWLCATRACIDDQGGLQEVQQMDV